MKVNEGFVDWLLASPTPSIRYFTMVHLPGRERDDAEVLAAQREIMRQGPVPAILQAQTERGDWQPEHSYYTPKYTSTHWSMLLLAELNADGDDPRLRRGAAHMLEATEAEAVENVVREAYGLSCFWGNVLRYALHCGLAGDPRVDRIIEYLVQDAVDWQWRCKHNWDLSCAWGAARGLFGLASIPAEKRSSSVREAIQKGLDFLLVGERLVQGRFPDEGRVHKMWSRLNFPLFYQADVLFVLRVAAELVALDHPGAQPALTWLRARRMRNGRWRGASPYRRRTWPELGDVNRWVSLHAAYILRGTQDWSG
ncbi:MAG TPA: hypothetical protein G4O08_06385 [Anaerolineae bacterium]|nr:hypothetical protein [Anaerolineae bacterium]